jgi:hypothetical protein
MDPPLPSDLPPDVITSIIRLWWEQLHLGIRSRGGVQYAIQVAEEEEEPFTWQTLSTVSVPAEQESLHQWTGVSDPDNNPIYANAFRLL